MIAVAAPAPPPPVPRSHLPTGTQTSMSKAMVKIDETEMMVFHHSLPEMMSALPSMMFREHHEDERQIDSPVAAGRNFSPNASLTKMSICTTGSGVAGAMMMSRASNERRTIVIISSGEPSPCSREHGHDDPDEQAEKDLSDPEVLTRRAPATARLSFA